MWRHGNDRGESNWSTQGIVNSRGLWLVRFAMVCCSVRGGVFVCVYTNRRRLGLHVLNPQTRSLIRFGIYLYVSTWESCEHGTWVCYSYTHANCRCSGRFGSNLHTLTPPHATSTSYEEALALTPPPLPAPTAELHALERSSLVRRDKPSYVLGTQVGAALGSALFWIRVVLVVCAVIWDVEDD